MRIYCFQNSLNSLESRISLPPALRRPPFFSEAINSGVGVAKLKLFGPRESEASCEELVTDEVLVCELLSIEFNEASECSEALDEFALWPC